MSDSEMIDFGHDCEKLLTDQSFIKVFNLMIDQSIQSIVSTEPADKDGRERGYYHYRALADLISTLKQQVAVRDEILSRDETINPSDNNEED